MAEKTKRGRKSLYTKQIVDEICKIISIGTSDKTAYDYVGISHETFYKWLKDEDEFSEAITRARAKGKLGLHQRVVSATTEDWRAGAWLLSHRYPDEYAETTQLRHEGGMEIKISYASRRSKNK